VYHIHLFLLENIGRPIARTEAFFLYPADSLIKRYLKQNNLIIPNAMTFRYSILTKQVSSAKRTLVLQSQLHLQQEGLMGSYGLSGSDT
jgi:hypothetical protein